MKTLPISLTLLLVVAASQQHSLWISAAFLPPLTPSSQTVNRVFQAQQSPSSSTGIPIPVLALPLLRVSRTAIRAQTEDEGDTTGPDVIQIESLSQDQIAELIEISFIQACLSLAQGYVDTLKLFIVAVKSAYERGTIGIDELVERVNQCPANTAGRPLLPEEEALRATWIHAVHLMLLHVGHKTSGQMSSSSSMVIAKDVRETYSPVLEDIVAIKESNSASWNTNDFVASHKDVLFPANTAQDQDQDDEVQLAIVSQTVKVLYYTLVVLAEERLANLEEDDEMPVTAKPKIPRGTGFN